MSNTGLRAQEIALLHAVFRQLPDIQPVLIFGSRALGNFRLHSDVDLALVGKIDAQQATAVAEALDQLPMPYQFDVTAYDSISHPPLLEHIRQVGVLLFQRKVHGASQPVDNAPVVQAT